MAKFVALFGLKKVTISWIEKDKEGNIIVDRTISFNKGLTAERKVIPAHLNTQNEDVIKFLRKYVGNEANGGKTYKEVKEEEVKPVKKTESKAKKESKKANDAPDDQVKAETQNSEAKVYEEVTTVQEAGAVLKELDSSLKARDVVKKADMFKVADSLNVSFPNLSRG